MPSAQDILRNLTAVANEWQPLAIAWHVLLGTWLLAIVFGRRPAKRLAGALLVLPIISVSVLAWWSGNAFNGAVFAVLAAALAGLAARLPVEPVLIGSHWLARSGIALILFAWTYPHFLETESWTTYLYSAPLGVVPCPTLAALVGVTLLVRTFESRTWATVVAMTGIFYGAVGIFRLGVTIDLILLAGASTLAGLAVTISPYVAVRQHVSASRSPGSRRR